MQIIPKGSPVPHDKAPATLLNSGHQPDNWSGLCRELRHEEVSFYLFLLPRLAATRPMATRPAATRPSATRSLSLAFEADQPRLPRSGLWTSVCSPNHLLINTTSGYGILATASRPSLLKGRQTKCHHTRWHSSHISSCTRLISQRLGGASMELWSATHWLPDG